MEVLRISNIMILLLLGVVFCSAQTGSDDKEVIIIEKVVDADGNVISQNTKRYKGKYTEEEVQDFIDQDDVPQIRSYDLDGLGFAEDFQNMFRSGSSKPTIGVNLDFDGGLAVVEKVTRGSGANKADIRIGDQLVSINDIAIATIEDIKEILDQKSSGDLIRLVIVRDGEELEKEVVLGSNNSGGRFFDLSEDGAMGFFNLDDMDMTLDMDSLLRGFMDQDDLFKGFDLFDNPGIRKNNSEDILNGDRPSLGVFLDDLDDGVVVADVIPDSPADQCGVRKGDLIKRMDDNIVSSYREISAYMNTKKRGDALTLQVERSGKLLDLNARLD